MKKYFRILLIWAMFWYGIGISHAEVYGDISPDAKIQEAIQILDCTGNKDATSVLTNHTHPTKVVFYDLTQLSFAYESHYAVATSDGFGTNYILINDKYKNEPKEAIACLIAHEITHQLPRATLDEEIRAWTNEAKQWIRCKQYNPDIGLINENIYPVVRRLNFLEKLYIAANYSSQLIAQEVENNPMYTKLALR